MLNYLYQLDNQGSINEQDVLQFIKEQIPEKETAIMSIAEEIEQRGVKKGMQEGKQEDARRMLDKGMPLQDIQDITGLSLDEVKQLKG